MNIFNIPIDPNPRVPAPPAPYRSILDIQMRFNDIDPLGHVNNAMLLEYFDLGKTHYFNTVRPAGMDPARVEVVIVHVDCDFFVPVYMGEKVAVLTQCTHISERSLHLEQQVVNRESGQVKCLCHTVMAGFDPDTASGAPINPRWTESIENFEQRNLHSK